MTDSSARASELERGPVAQIKARLVRERLALAPWVLIASCGVGWWLLRATEAPAEADPPTKVNERANGEEDRQETPKFAAFGTAQDYLEHIAHQVGEADPAKVQSLLELVEWWNSEAESIYLQRSAGAYERALEEVIAGKWSPEPDPRRARLAVTQLGEAGRLGGRSVSMVVHEGGLYMCTIEYNQYHELAALDQLYTTVLASGQEEIQRSLAALQRIERKHFELEGERSHSASAAEPNLEVNRSLHGG